MRAIQYGYGDARGARGTRGYIGISPLEARVPSRSALGLTDLAGLYRPRCAYTLESRELGSPLSIHQPLSRYRDHVPIPSAIQLVPCHAHHAEARFSSTPGVDQGDPFDP